MHLGTKGRYAVMAMIQLVAAEKEQRYKGYPIPLSVIAEQQEISILYLEQIFSKLRKKGLVRSVRGVGGGYVLGRPPHEISVADVMEAAEESFHITRCTPQNKKGCLHNQKRCQVHHVWEELERRLFQYLHSLSLEEIYQDPQTNRENQLIEVKNV
ncbi:MAG: Rrf2 family transcriptional regulator [Proteobacteria bacterium]|nr:Rrf2 family transcriptional regulator [Pseudomonadota bacterium]